MSYYKIMRSEPIPLYNTSECSNCVALSFIVIVIIII